MLPARASGPLATAAELADVANFAAVRAQRARLDAVSLSTRAQHIVAVAVPSGDAPFPGVPFPPSAWTFDGAPALIQSVAASAWFREQVRGIALPPLWLADAHTQPPGAAGDLALEDALLDGAVMQQLLGARAPSTLALHRLPWLKLILWLALRCKPLHPPLEADVWRYMAMLTALRRNQSAASSALQAVNFVLSINDLPSFSSTTTRALQKGARKAFAATPKKAPPLEKWMVKAIVLGCCSVHADECRCMFGIAVLALFMCTCRFSDLCRLRWDADFCEDFGTHMRLYFDRRKNDSEYKGHFVDIAELPGESDFAAITWLRAARARFGSGPVLRRVWRRHGSVLAPPFFGPNHNPPALRGEPCNMAIDEFNQTLTAELVACCGLAPDIAEDYTSHGGRAGSATTLKRARVDPDDIRARAGVSSLSWVPVYDRGDLARSLATSAALEL
jgi:hypothetical protein